MEDTLYDLVIGNIDALKLPDMSHFSAAQLLDLCNLWSLRVFLRKF